MPELQCVTIKDDVVDCETTVTVFGVDLLVHIEWFPNYVRIDEDGFPEPHYWDCFFTVGESCDLDIEGEWHFAIFEQIRYELWAVFKLHLVEVDK